MRQSSMWATIEYPRKQLSQPTAPHNDSDVGLDALHWLTRSRAAHTLHIEVVESMRSTRNDVVASSVIYMHR